MQISVRQLKQRIHEKTNVDVDLQRLIYCGRVMNDDHPLSDYGKFQSLQHQMNASHYCLCVFF